MFLFNWVKNLRFQPFIFRGVPVPAMPGISCSAFSEGGWVRNMTPSTWMLRVWREDIRRSPVDMVVSPMIYRVLYIHTVVVWDFFPINSMIRGTCLNRFFHFPMFGRVQIFRGIPTLNLQTNRHSNQFFPDGWKPENATLEKEKHLYIFIYIYTCFIIFWASTCLVSRIFSSAKIFCGIFLGVKCIIEARWIRCSEVLTSVRPCPPSGVFGMCSRVCFLYRWFMVVVVVWSGHFFLTCHTMDNSTGRSFQIHVVLCCERKHPVCSMKGRQNQGENSDDYVHCTHTHTIVHVNLIIIVIELRTTFSGKVC